MNELQHISEAKFGPVLVTLNPPFEPTKSTIRGRWSYDHPVLDSKVGGSNIIYIYIYRGSNAYVQAVEAQGEMHLIQNKRGISFAGAYLKYGFHEDGFTSGLRAAFEHLGGVQPPFPIRDPDRHLPGLWTAFLFDFIETSGLRTVTLFLLSLVLSAILFVLRIFVNVDL